MATCEKCGASFKPYWRFTDVEESICEHCVHQQDEKRKQRLVTAFVTLAIGLIAVIAGAAAASFFLKLAGFILLLFGLLKLIEFTVIGGSAAPQQSYR